ncbi:thioredoxin domain-containing protein [Flavobacterium cyanobacteriorum]|uniref:Thioredoxin domain-containing protein n=1 Tax=Flavobacterium cyanobacteriorum TaxID=2022802 RepID=A0A255Z0C2_9FLAO|nr:thioredoxin domain-containing protein [Flavobacterium cyanobacteriorum]OYQ34394.1 thioredoxin domain-containing protein [Flavobacterium cyanobacteriorum]
MNELHLETSPYLLQHAGNPIHWKAWNDKTLAEARGQQKLMVLSVGYSACHWCHVMEHESFEDHDVAAVMNRYYVSIKVDREERPDVDATYMKAVQLMTGHGGWPMNVVLLPDARPVWGGTYFRKNDWINALEQLHELFVTDPQKMEDYAEKLTEGIASLSLVDSPDNYTVPPPEDMEPLIKKWIKSFDWEFGGYARAPKFMMPGDYMFLQRYAYQHKLQNILDFVDLTLTRMAYGGIFDVVGGGFSRYSVDMKWHVPHFEKMLYDNGQLMSLYAEAYKRTGNTLYLEVIKKTHAFIERELALPEGGFYSALDADSPDGAGHLEEGAFYVWEKQQLMDLLGNDFDAFARVFSINDFGFWENGKFVLIQREAIEDLAEITGMEAGELKSKKKAWEEMLFSEREKRPKPRLDDKVLTSWNALMLKGYADCYKATGDEAYLQAAQKNATFIAGRLWDSSGKLWRTYKNGTAKIEGFLEDYATTADAFIALFEASAEEKWLHYARQLTDYCLEHFYEEGHPFFRYSPVSGEQLITPHYETEDNVIPASNSILANVLYKLGLLFENQHYEKRSLHMLRHIIPTMDYPSAFSNWLNLWLTHSGPGLELAVCGPGATESLKQLNSRYLPHVLIAGCSALSAVPFLKGRFAENELLYYVCRNRACNLPTSSLSQTLAELEL